LGKSEDECCQNDGIATRPLSYGPDGRHPVLGFHARIRRRCLSLLRSDVQGLVNIGGGKAGPQREVMDGLTQRLGGGDLINIGGRPRGTAEPSNIGADATRLIEEVGFRPVYGGKTRLTT